MELLDYRPLAIFIIEVIIAFVVWRKGKFHKGAISIFILFLAGYQLGEFLLIKSPEVNFGYQFAFFSTTMLLPMGVLILEKAKNKFLGSPIFFLTSISFGIIFFLSSSFVQMTEKCLCFAKFAPRNESDNFLLIWGVYYLFTLFYVLVLNIFYYLREQNNKRRQLLLGGMLANFFIYPFTYVLMVVFNVDIGYATSVMCSMGLLGAIIIAYTTLSYKE